MDDGNHGKKARLSVDERRRQLLELGQALFASRNYTEVSIDEIAAAAQVSKGLLYHYFPSKRAFYLQTISAAASRLQEMVQPDPTLPPEVRGYRGVAAYLEFVEQRRDAYTTLLRSAAAGDAEVHAIVESTRLAVVEQSCRAVGVDASRPIYRLALRGWVGQVEATCAWWLEHQQPDRDAVLRMLALALHQTFLTAATMDPEAGLKPEDLPSGLPSFRT